MTLKDKICNQNDLNGNVRPQCINKFFFQKKEKHSFFAILGIIPPILPESLETSSMVLLAAGSLLVIGAGATIAVYYFGQAAANAAVDALLAADVADAAEQIRSDAALSAALEQVRIQIDAAHRIMWDAFTAEQCACADSRSAGLDAIASRGKEMFDLMVERADYICVEWPPFFNGSSLARRNADIMLEQGPDWLRRCQDVIDSHLTRATHEYARQAQMLENAESTTIVQGTDNVVATSHYGYTNFLHYNITYMLIIIILMIFIRGIYKYFKNRKQLKVSDYPDAYQPWNSISTWGSRFSLFAIYYFFKTMALTFLYGKLYSWSNLKAACINIKKRLLCLKKYSK